MPPLGARTHSQSASRLTCASDGGSQDRAFEQTQKYKEGRFILEKNLLCQAEATDWDAGECPSTSVSLLQFTTHGSFPPLRLARWISRNH